MNHIYRLKRSGRKQLLQPVPETARSACKGQTRTGSAAAWCQTLAGLVSGVVAGMALGGILTLVHAQQAPPLINQLPQGGVVSRGRASISSGSTPTGTALMTVNQTSNRAVIDWASFNVGSQAKVQFNQPSSSAVVLNQVLGNNASQIYGQINANGQVILSNPNGIYFSPTASVDVGSLVATTGKANADEFMAGTTRFARDGSSASVVNEGQLKAALGGYIALLAPEVRNQGIVIAQAGTVALATGEAITLNFNTAGTGLTGITTTPQAIAALVENRSAVLAEGGQIILSAHALATLNNAVVKNSGQLSATSLSEKGGKIVLMGERIELTGTSQIDANGPQGGGTVLVGGDWQGSGDTRQAVKVTMASGASIEASATDKGDGGKVVLWSDVKNVDSVTRVEGSIKAEAGPQGGDGGKIETSGHQLQIGDLTVAARAPQGAYGEWLLDPYDVTISSGATSGVGITYTSIFPSGYSATANDSVVNVASLMSALGNTNVTIDTGSSGTQVGNITLASDISWNTSASLTLKAAGGFTGSGNVTFGGSGSLNVQQAGNSTFSGNISGASGRITIGGVGYAGTLTLTGNNSYGGGTTLTKGTLSLGSINAIGTSGIISFGGGTLQYSLANNTDYSSRFSASGQSYSIDTNGIDSTLASNLGAGSFAKLGAGTLTLTGANSSLTTVTITGGNLQVGNGGTTGSIRDASTVTVSSNSTLIFNRSDNITYSMRSIGGAGGVTQAGTGTLALSSTKTYTGPTYAKAGILDFSGSSISTISRLTVDSGATFKYSGQQTFGSLTGSGAIAFISNGAGIINVGGDNTDFEFSGQFQGATGGPQINKQGIGTFTFSGSSSGPYYAPTVSTGTMVIGKGGTEGLLGATTATVNAGATLTFNRSDTVSTSGFSSSQGSIRIIGTGGLALTGGNQTSSTATFYLDSGTLAMSVANGNSPFIGIQAKIVFGGGTLKYGTSSTQDYSGNFSTANNQLYIIDTNGSNVTFANNLTSSGGSLTKLGAGTLTLTGTNTYDGTTTVNAGTLQIGTSALSTGTLGSGAVTLADTTSLVLKRKATDTVTLTNSISGPASGSASVQFSDGTWSLGTGSGFGSNIKLTFNGGKLQYTANNTTDYSAKFDSSTANQSFNIDTNGQNITLASGFGTTGSTLTKTGTGTLTLSGANTYTGTTTISAGTLAVANATALGDTSSGTVVSSGAVLDVQGVAVGAEALTLNGNTFKSSTGTGSYGGTIALGGAATFEVASGSQLTLGGILSGSGNSLTKTGAGSLILTASSTYSGATTISAGTLQIGNGGTTGSLTASTVTNNSSLVINRSGNFSLGNAITSTMASGTGNFSIVAGGNLTIGNAVTLTGTSSLIDISAGGDLTIGSITVSNTGTTGTVNLSAGGKVLFSASGSKVSASGTGALIKVIAGSNLMAGDTTAGYDIDMTAATAPALTTASSGTLILYQGNPATTSLSAKLSGATGSKQYKTYGATAASLSSAITGTRNFYYRASGSSITVSGVTASKTYDGNDNAIGFITGGSVAGLSGEESGMNVTSLTFATARFNNANAGTNKTLTLGGVAIDSATWSVTGMSASVSGGGNSTITKANLQLRGSKTYDGTTAMPGAGLTALGVNSESFTVTGSGDATNLASANVQTGSTLSSVTGLAIGTSNGTNLGLASNYNLATTASSVSVNHATATLTASKTYDGGTTLSGSQLSITGVTVNGVTQTLGYTGSAIVSDPNVATANNYVASGSLALTNGTGLAANYVLPAYSLSANNTASISPATVTLSAAKTYDGTTGLSAGQLTITGVASQTLGYSGTPVLQSPNVADNSSNYVQGVSALADNGSALASNYQLPSQAVASSKNTVTLSKANLTALSASKTYDGLLTVSAAQMGSIEGVSVNGTPETFAATAGTASISDKNVSTAGKSITSLAGLTLSGVNGSLTSNYNLTSNLPAAGANNAVTIAPATASVAAAKTYDGSKSLSSAQVTISGVAGETLDYSGSAELLSQNVVDNASNYVSGITQLNDKPVGGVTYLASNYQLPSQLTRSVSNTAQVNKADLSRVVASKTYDGLQTVTAAQMLTIEGISGEAFSATAGTASISDKNVATANKTLVDVSGLTLVGANGELASNYYLSSRLPASGNQNAVTITPKTLMVGGLSAPSSRTYNATQQATVTGTPTLLAAESAGSGADSDGKPYQGDTVGFSGTASGTYNTKNVDATTVSFAGLSSNNSNYTLSLGSQAASITPANLSVSGVTAQNKTYDAGLAASLSGTASVTGLLSDQVSVTGTPTASFADKNVGTAKPVTVTGYALTGTDAANYNVVQPTGLSADITKADLQITGVGAVNKVYDTTRAATLSGSATVTGLLTDDVSLSGSGTGTFANKNVGTGKAVTVTGYSLNGADAGNYNLLAPAGLTADITPAPLTVNGITANSKTYDGDTTATLNLSGVQKIGLLGSDVVTVTAVTGTFDSANAGTGKTVTLSAHQYGGADAGNYTITDQTSTNANIDRKLLGLNIPGASRMYDGTTTITLSPGEVVSLNGVVGSDDVSMGAGALIGFLDKNVGVNKLVTYSGFNLAGTTAGNYSLPANATSTGTITAAPLSISGITAANKTYDGNTTATLSTTGVVKNGLVAGDSVTVTSSGVFPSKNVGNGKTVTLTNNYAGADAGNYTITDQTSTTADISLATLTISGITAAHKTYDGNTNAVVSTAGLVKSGLVVGDAVTVSSSGVFADKNAGTGKTVTLTNSYAGVDVGNYAIVDQTTSTANIIPAVLTISGSNAASKTYDGNTNAVITAGSLNGLVGTESLTVTGAASFASKNVGNYALNTAYTLTDAGTGASAGLASNYTLANENLNASITAKTLTISGIAAANKTYDGNSTASVSTALVAKNGLVDGDTVTVTSSGVFADKNVGTGKTVTLTNTYAGADAGNYAITDQTSTTANISQAGLTISGITAANKTYDGTTSVSVNTASVAKSGLIAGDTVTVSSSGVFADKNAATGKTVTLTNTYAGSDAGNYAINDQTTTTANISQAALTISGITAANKTYDGNTTASVSTGSVVKSGLIAGDTVTLASSGVFVDKNAATGKTVNLTNTYAGADAGNYAITDQTTTTANISQAAMTISGITAANKTYDGNSTASVSTGSVVKSGLVVGDTVTLASSGVFADKNAATGKTVNLTNTYTGADAGNYAITDQTTATANIAQATLTISGITAGNKTYDGNSTASVSTALVAKNGLVLGDTVTVASSGVFADKNAATGKTVTLTNTYAGADAGNYAITDQTTTTANISQAAMTISGITAANKTYDGNTTASVSTAGVVKGGLIAGDTVTLASSGVFADKNAGTGKTVTLTNTYTGADAGNYAITDQTTTTANISQAAMTISGITAANKTYDGNTSATVSTGSVLKSGLIAGDTVTLASSGVFVDKNAATGKTVNLTNTYAGADAGNYAITDQTSTTANISQAALTISGITASNKTYDGNTSATVSTGSVVKSGLIAGDTVTVSSSGVFADKNAATGKTVTLTNTYAGADAGNYAITDQTTASANIAQAALTITGITAANKTYDGTTTASVSTGSVVKSGLIAGDTVTVASSGVFADKNAATGKTVTLTNTYAGADVSNYAITDQTSTTANISQAALTISGITAANKTYDGNTTASVSTAGVVKSGLVVGDTVTLASSGVFADKNAATGKTVTLTNTYAGADAGNYAITDQTTATANIAQAALTISGITAANKTYDGNTSATVSTGSVVKSGQIAGDTVTVSSSGVFADKNAATGKTVTLTNTYAGADAGNYTITDQTTATANIAQAAMTISGITASNKTYDGTTSATVSTASVAKSGLIAGDTVTVASSGVFADKNAATGKTVTLTNTYAGADAGNYAITDQTTATANIAQAALTISGITAANKTYDGNTSATVSTGSVVKSGMIAGDTVTVASSGVFADKNAATGKTVTLTNTYAGADAGNYAITDQTSTTANIGQAALTITGITATNKTYDGNTSATVSTGSVVKSGLIAGDTVTVASSGVFADKNAATGKTVTLTNSYAGGDVGNYTITDQTTATANITPKALTMFGAILASKTYDGNTNAVVTPGALNGLVGTETLAVSGAGAFGSKNVGSYSVNTAYTLSDAGTGASAGLASNYTLANENLNASITAKALTITGISASNKTYDGTTSATVSTGSVVKGGLIAGDTVTVSSSGVFVDKNAGTGKTVTLTNTYAGLDAGNYAITDQTTTTANISQAAMTISGITAANKTYDGNTSATVSTGSVVKGGLIAGDTVTVSSSGVFADKNAGSGKTVNLTNTYAGADAGNYTITDQTTTTANIAQAALTMTAQNASKLIGQADPGFNATYSGFVNGEKASVLSSASVTRTGTDTAANTYTGVLVPSASATNYSITAVNGNFTIVPADTLLVTLSNSSKTYGASVSGLTAASAQYVTNGNTLRNVTLTNLGNGSYYYSDGLGTTGSFQVATSASSTSVVGNYGITLTNFVKNGSNFTSQTSQDGNLVVNPLAVTLGTVNVAKVYNGNTAAQATVSVANKVGVDDVAVLGVGSYTDNKNVGTAHTYSLSTQLTGAAATNYYLSSISQSGSDGVITPAPLTISGITAANKTYDGNTSATVSTGSVVKGGLIAGDTVTVASSGVFANKNAATGKTVNLTNTYAGADAGNYAIIDQTTATANIAQAALTISGITAGNKTYDGNTTASVRTGSVVKSGLIAGDTVTVSSSGVFADKNAATGKTVNLTNTYAGADAGNYAITDQTTATANIAQAALTISGITAGNKTYDGTTSSTVSTGGVVKSGLFAGDTVTVSSSGVFADKNAGSGKTVNLTNTYAGADAGNYTITDQTSTTANITPKALTMFGAILASKTYDGTTNAVVTPGTLNGLVGTETLAVSGAGAFGSKNVGSYSVNTAYTLSDAGAGASAGLVSNYTLANENLNASITAKALTISGITAGNKTYDGNSTASVSTALVAKNGLVVGDTVTVASSGVFVGKNAGTGKTVTLTNTYAGADAGNYAITDQTTATANIAQAALTISGITAANKTYDGTTSATVSTGSVVKSGLIAGDTVTVASSGVFADKNAGSGKTVNLINTYAGADAGNYTITDQTTTTANITPKALTVTALAANKTYDGQAFQGGNGESYSGLVNGESASVLNGVLTYAGTAQGATHAGLYAITPSGLSSSNYSVNYQDGALTIQPAPLQWAALQGSVSKTYNGTADASLSSANYQLTGWVGSEGGTVTQTVGIYDSPQVGKNKTVSAQVGAADVQARSGTDMANYSVPTATVQGAVGVIEAGASSEVLRWVQASAVATGPGGGRAAEVNATYQWPALEAVNVSQALDAGLLNITVLRPGGAATSAVAFEQEADTISLRQAATPLTRPAQDKVVFTSKMTEFMVENPQGQLVEFLGGMVNRRLVIVAPSPESKQLAQAQMNMVLAGAIMALGKNVPIMLAKLDGVVLDLR